jgi:hypothetical protein
MTDMTVAKTILEQLGGRRFSVMTGAKNYTGHGASETDMGALSFRLPGSGGFTKSGINYVKVTLTPSDVYSVEFGKVRGTKYTVVSKAEEVYCDMLQDVFCEHTGLFTSMGTMGG